MDLNIQVFDVIGNRIKVGDLIVQYRGSGLEAGRGSVRSFRVGKDGRERILADGDFSRPFLPRSVLDITALGVALKPRKRSEVYPDKLREYNRRHIKDAVGTEARANDKVLFWVSSKQLGSGTIRYFGESSLTVLLDDPAGGRSFSNYTVKQCEFLILKGTCPVPEELLYHKRVPALKSVPARKKKTPWEKLREATEVIASFGNLFADWEAGKVADPDFRVSVELLMNNYQQSIVVQ